MIESDELRFYFLQFLVGKIIFCPYKNTTCFADSIRHNIALIIFIDTKVNRIFDIKELYNEFYLIL